MVLRLGYLDTAARSEHAYSTNPYNKTGCGCFAFDHLPDLPDAQGRDDKAVGWRQHACGTVLTHFQQMTGGNDDCVDLVHGDSFPCSREQRPEVVVVLTYTGRHTEAV